MSYDPETGIHRSAFPPIPDHLFPNVTVDELLFNHTSPNPESIWLVDALTGKTFTKADALDRTGRIARAFREGWDLSQDDCVVVFSGNEIHYPLVLWATFKCGAIASSANPNYGTDELRFQISLVNEHHSVKVIVTHPDSLVTAIAACRLSNLLESAIVLMFSPSASSSDALKMLATGFKTLDDLAGSFEGRPVPVAAKLEPGGARRKLAFLSFSSGTTGLPKAVAITHGNVVANIIQSHEFWKRTRPFAPFDANTQEGDKVLGCLPFYHIYGLVVVLHSSLYMGVPVVTLNKMVILMVKNALVDDYDLSTLRFGMAGAAPLTEEVTLMVLTNPLVTDTFGADEYRAQAKVSKACVWPRLAKVVSPDGKTLGIGEVGELHSRSPANAIGYLGNEKATKETFSEDGLIKCKGMQVAPAELEGLLLDHPDVQDVCVIGIPDDRAGERPKGAASLREGSDTAASTDHF
ncbi:hypothetical protein P7C70_g228, partial [Phenoliferia sp. Uapishka_3]